MANVVIPFLMSMFLGRTIDIRSYDIGVGLFDNQQYDEVKLNDIKTTYRVLQNNVLPYSFMGLPVDIALRIKSGILSSSSGHMGLDGLLTDSTWKQRSVTIAVATAAQMVNRSTKKDAQPFQNWNSTVSKSQTHYADSVMYGGWSFILYRFKCDIPGDVEIVRETLTKALGVQGEFGPDTIRVGTSLRLYHVVSDDTISLILEGECDEFRERLQVGDPKWEGAMESIRKNHEIRGEVDIFVNSYSSFPFKYDVSSPQAILEAIKEIPKLIGPVGKPIFMELVPLHSLDPSYPDVKENHVLDNELEKLDAMYDDVRNTKHSISRWVEETETLFTDEEETKISDLLAHLSTCLKLFHQVANDASIYKSMDQGLLKSAFKLYNSQLSNYAENYDSVFRILKEEIGDDCQDTFHHKIKGLLTVDDAERIEVGEVEGGLQECKEACLAAPQCRSIGYVDTMFYLQRVKSGERAIYSLKQKNKICYVYFRSSSTASVTPPKGASVTAVYDRMCK